MAKTAASRPRSGATPSDFITSFYTWTPSGFMVEYGWGARAIDPATWQAFERKAGPSMWGHDRPGSPQRIAPARALRLQNAADGMREPVQVMEGNYQLMPGVCPWWTAQKKNRRPADVICRRRLSPKDCLRPRRRASGLDIDATERGGKRLFRLRESGHHHAVDQVRPRRAPSRLYRRSVSAARRMSSALMWCGSRGELVAAVRTAHALEDAVVNERLQHRLEMPRRQPVTPASAGRHRLAVRMERNVDHGGDRKDAFARQ